MYNVEKSRIKGKIFTLTHDTNANGRIDIDDLQWEYLEGDGDFRSAEVTALRDEADIIITNPPFSLFREFLAWIMEGKKQFLIIGSSNSVCYKEVFLLIKDNIIWLGVSSGSKTYLKLNGDTQTMGNTCWFTNIDHGRRHQPLCLMSMEDNLRFNKKMKGKTEYSRYVNYDAIEVPNVELIPSDYEGKMGVPISILDKYCPEQFEIIGQSLQLADMNIIKKVLGKAGGGPRFYIEEEGKLVRLYERLVIRKKQ